MMNFFLEFPALVQMSRSILKYEEILTRKNSVLGRFLRHASNFFLAVKKFNSLFYCVLLTGTSVWPLGLALT